MSSYTDDPDEFVGRDHAIKADAIKDKAPKPVAATPLAEELAQPEPVKKPGSHPKHAIARPAREWADAQQEVMDAQAELKLATDGLRLAETTEGEAFTAWMSLQPKVDPNQLLRDAASRSGEQRADNVRNGRPPEGVKTPSHGNSPLDIAAAQRPRGSSGPLRSPVARRVV